MIEKKLLKVTISLLYFYSEYFLSSCLSESGGNFILNKMSHEKFQSDRNANFSLLYKRL